MRTSVHMQDISVRGITKRGGLEIVKNSIMKNVIFSSKVWTLLSGMESHRIALAFKKDNGSRRVGSKVEGHGNSGGGQ